jgi:Holliday junction resolvase RusA-like endonuclease
MPTPHHKQWRQAAVEAVKRAVAETGWQTVTGPVAAEIVAIWPRKIASGEMAGFAFGDIDAPVKAVLDAVAAGGVIEDDKQVVKARLTKQHGEPCVTVIIERLT